MEDEKRYTLAEAATELMRRECERDRHSPRFPIGGTMADPIPVGWACECGEVRWMRERQ